MHFSASILGLSVSRALQERHRSALLTIGKDVFDRGVLANTGCYSFVAAGNLSRLIRELGVKDTRDLFEHIAPERLVLPRLGAVTLAVLGAAFEAKGLGGDAPLEAWFTAHQRQIVTFDTMKARDQKRERDRLAKRRPHDRRTRQHSTRSLARVPRERSGDAARSPQTARV